MKKTSILVFLSIALFSCDQKAAPKKELKNVADSVLEKKTESDTAVQKKLEEDSIAYKKAANEEIVRLPQHCYAVITLEYYKDKEDPAEQDLGRPIRVKVFDSKTKKELPEAWQEGYYSSEIDDYGDSKVMYGDFNFDGKMDVACMGRNTAYRDFHFWNFYLATTNGYEFSSAFSKIMDEPIAYLKLDAKEKKIFAYREAEFDEYWIYQVHDNKPDLIENKSSVRYVSPGDEDSTNQ